MHSNGLLSEWQKGGRCTIVDFLAETRAMAFSRGFQTFEGTKKITWFEDINVVVTYRSKGTDRHLYPGGGFLTISVG